MKHHKNSSKNNPKMSKVERFMRATDKLRFFLGPADRDYDEKRDTVVKSKTTSVKSSKRS